jgi:hypothetical protein
MKAKIANSTRLNVVGNVERSDQEFFSSALKQWFQRLGYCSIFAAAPAILASHVAEARSDKEKKPETSVAGWTKRFPDRLSRNCSSPELLKRQSKFRLPHQKGNFTMLAPFSGNDDCPGRPIPGGTYTAASPFNDSGDTTGANNSVTSLFSPFYYYYGYDAHGPDHVYSFTLTGRGSNPHITVSTTSGTYRPLIYVLEGGFNGACPAGTGNSVGNALALNDSRWTPGSSTITLDMSGLPLNVPLYMFVDSALSDASGSGGYTIRMQDVTISSPGCSNPADCAEFFVRQHYFDFLGREPDAEGLNFWANEIKSCGGDAQCEEVKRINVSAAFFLSIEFQESGYLVYRMYKAAYGDLPLAPVPLTLQEFLPDTQRVGRGVVVGKVGWEQQLLNNKNAFANEFVSRSRFIGTYSPGMRSDQFFDTLNANAGGPFNTAERNQLVGELESGTKTRAQVLRIVAENAKFARNEFNKAFVLMQYFGYLHRNPNAAPDNNFNGYNFWLDKLNQFDGNFVEAEMVKAFINSIEYRQRFGTP